MFLLKNILGIGSNVTTPNLDLYFVLYFLANSNNFWCPECKPSKLPINIIDFLVEKSGFLNSNSEARRSLDEKSIYINKVKVSKDYIVSQSDLLKNKYIVINKGKKKTFMVEILKI